MALHLHPRHFKSRDLLPTTSPIGRNDACHAYNRRAGCTDDTRSVHHSTRLARPAPGTRS
jgi:hypothetical protein